MSANQPGVAAPHCGTTLKSVRVSAARRLRSAGLRATVIAVLSVLALVATSALAQTVSLAPVALSFGVPSGTTYTVAPSTYPGSAPGVVTVTIVGASTSNPVMFTLAAAVTGANSTDFIIDGNSCAGTFTSPNTCQLTLHFNASKAPANTLETALLTITSSASPGTLTVPLSGAYGSIKLFDETNITPAPGSSSFANLYAIATKTLNLTCSTSPVTAAISGTPDGSGYILVDNYLTLATGPVSTTVPPPPLTPVNDEPFSSQYPAGNVCGGPGSSSDYDNVHNSDDNNCVSDYYVTEIYDDGFTPSNSDPDSFANPGNSVLPPVVHGTNAGGVPPVDIHTFLAGFPTGSYPEQALFTLSTSGPELVYDNSTLFLVTNCTAPGIVPGASTTLNPINTSSPATQTQTATLDNSPGQNISFTYGTGVAIQNDPTILNSGIVPIVTDFPIPQQLFSQLVGPSTSAAPAICMRVAGELDASGNPMCKGFLLQCYNSATGTTTGDNCSNSSTALQSRYLLFTTQFTSPDGPSGYNYLTTQPWSANLAYSTGQTIVDPGGYVQQVTTAGTSGVTTPAFNETVGGTTNDGSVTWTNEGVNSCLNMGPGVACAAGTGPGLLMGGDNWLCGPGSTAVTTGTSLTCAPPEPPQIGAATGQTIPAGENNAGDPWYVASDCVLTGGLAGAPCPLNVMSSVLGAADIGPKGSTGASNSLFVPVVNMPLPTGSATLGSGWSGGWTSSPSTATVNFTANAATYPGSGTIPPSNGFSAAPVYSVTTGLSPSNQSLPDTTYPISTDDTLTNSATSPNTPFCNVGGTTPASFSPTATIQNINGGSNPADGLYYLHYFPTDCAFTEGLVYTPTPAQVTDPTANWASFPYTTVGIDTQAPTFSACASPTVRGSSPPVPAVPTAAGWYNTDLTEQCQATDQNYVAGQSGSGFLPLLANSLQGSPTEEVSVSTNVGAGNFNPAASTGAPSACDLANNCGTGTAGGPFMIDEQPPTVSASAGTSSVGGTVITVTFTCSDAGSGIPSGGCGIGGTPANYTAGLCAPSNGSSVVCGGTIATAILESGTLTATATDNAGNVTTTMTNYSVGQGAQTITLTTPPSAVYGSSFSVQATGGASGNPVTFTNGGGCTNVGAYYTMTSGTTACSVIANQKGNANYLQAPQVTNSVNATLAAPMITFGPAPVATYPGNNFVVSATTNSNGSLTYSYVSGPCTLVSAGTFAPTGTGTCMVQANTAVTTNFSAASNIQNVNIGAPVGWTIAPSPYTFPQISVGQVASEQFEVYNPGPTAIKPVISIPSNTNGVGGADNFKITTNTCASTKIPVGGTCNVTVKYTANQNGLTLPPPGNYAYLDVKTNGTLLVQGYMTAMTVDPTVSLSASSYGFGSQTTGTAITEEVATLTNTGPTTLIFGSVAVTSGAFTVSTGEGTNCTKNENIAPGGSCAIYMTFTPSKKGKTYAATVTLNGNAANLPQTITLSGTGD